VSDCVQLQNIFAINSGYYTAAILLLFLTVGQGLRKGIRFIPTEHWTSDAGYTEGCVLECDV